MREQTAFWTPRGPRLFGIPRIHSSLARSRLMQMTRNSCARQVESIDAVFANAARCAECCPVDRFTVSRNDGGGSDVRREENRFADVSVP